MSKTDISGAKEIISLSSVSYTYPDSPRPAVDDVTLGVREGEFLAILGRNGSGKSTLARLLNALILPDKGEVVVSGIPAKDEDSAYDIRRACGMVFQNPDNQIVATIVEEDCAFGPENLGVPPQEIRRRVDESLAAVGMAEYASSAPHMLSGGQKQRIAVAGVLAMKPRVIVFDESTAMLDPAGRRDIFSIARRLNREDGITIVWITHFMDEAAQADRLIVMDEGKKALEGTPREVFSQRDRISGMGLDCPGMTLLAARLNELGVRVPRDILTVDEMVKEMAKEMEVATCRSK